MLQWLSEHYDAIKAQCRLVVIADPDMLQQRATTLNLNIKFAAFDAANFASATESAQQQPYVFPVKTASVVTAGRLDADNSHYVIETLHQAVDGCLTGLFDGMVTAPVHKAIINDAGIAFTGHTELLAERCHAPLPVMMLATDTLRVILATTHLPLREVPDAITQTLLRDIIAISHRDLQRFFAIQQPHLKVCGLNPHAGEGGHLGHEEIDTIIPALQQLKSTGINVTGPYPADTVFAEHHLVDADAVVAMYHDQGLPVLKHHGFGRAANITLGLPIIRTSVDHGTALDLAGTGQANCGSFNTAIQQALIMAQASSRRDD